MPRLSKSRSLLALFTLLALLATPARAQENGDDNNIAADDPGHSSGASSEIYSSPAVAQRLFADLVCLCGDCKRLTLKACGCPNAVAERAKIMAMLAGKDISTHEKEEAVYVEIRDALIKEYGGQHILTVPLDTGFNRLGWMVPWAVFVLCLGMVFVVGRRWISRGRADTASRATASAGATEPRKSVADEEREDRLDDELRDLD